MNAITHRSSLSFRPKSVDDATRTAELIASSGAGVERQDFEGPFIEVLSVSAPAIDLSRADGMPLLDSHRQDGLDRILGVVRSVRFEAGAMIVTVEFSTRAEAIFQDVKAGIIRNVSVGYRPITWIDSQDAKGARIRTVTNWEVLEVSLVPVGADPAAKVRNASMSGNIPTPAPNPSVSLPNLSVPQPVQARAAVNSEIRALAATFDLGSDWANGLIDGGASEGEARAAALEFIRIQRSVGPRITVAANHGDPAHIRSHMSEALYATRINPRHALSEAARPYAAMTTLDMARECLRAAGISHTGLNPADTIQRALHTTSDFPTIFANVANRTLRPGYEAAPAVLKSVARQSTARDFRAKTKVQAADMAKLQRVGEGGEYKYSSFVEAKETYAVGTYGTIVGLSRQAIINDDLSAFSDLAAKLGLASAEFEAQFMADLLTQNNGAGPIMDDGKTVFHASHGNTDAAAALSIASLSAARLAMRRAKGINGRPISVAPKFLVVPPELETIAETILASIQPTKSADVNPFGGKLELLVEARLTDPKRWYVAGNPAVVEGLEYSYLQGAEGPQTESRAGFEVDGVEVKVRLDFGAAFLDWRGWYTNPGL